MLGCHSDFDLNKDGSIDYGEFKIGLKHIGMDIHDADFDRLVIPNCRASHHSLGAELKRGRVDGGAGQRR